MARNKNRKKKIKTTTGNRDVLGVTLIVISAFLLLCIVIKPILGVFSEAIFGVLLGVFGIASYPILIATLILGIFMLGGRKIQADTKIKVGISLAVIFGLIILQLASTHSFLNKNFSGYISSIYSAKYSAGGIIMGVIAYGLQALITEIATYVIFSLALIVDILLMTSAFKKLRVWSKNRALKKAQAQAEQVVEEPDFPEQPQLVVDATPLPGLFVGTIERNTPEISVESGSASDMPVSTARKVSDYSERPVFDDESEARSDHNDVAAAARVKLYSDKEEIKRQAAEEFRAAKAAEQAPQAQAQPVAPTPTPAPESVYAVYDNMEPAARVFTDAQNSERPRRVDYDGTPNNLNALYFPPDKNIHFNDVGIENFVDEHPKHVEPEVKREPIYDGSDPVRPAFGMPRTDVRLERVEPIIDASQPFRAASIMGSTRSNRTSVRGMPNAGRTGSLPS